MEEDGPFSIKRAILKDPTVIQPILSVHGGPETFGELESQTFGGSPNDLLLWFKYYRDKGRRGFFPEKFVNSFSCKRNYFVLQTESTTFVAGESEMWNVSTRLNE